MNMKMSMPEFPSEYDVKVYRALSALPKNLEEKPLSPSEFISHFKDFFGRPIQDIVEALRCYGKQGYLNFELKLSPEYLKYGDFHADSMAKLSGTTPDKYCGLGKSIYNKVLAKQPLTTVEASNLPDSAKSRLTFSLSAIDRQRLNEGLIIYDSGIHLPIIQQGRAVAKLQPFNIKDVKLKPESYNKDKGILHLTTVHVRHIASSRGVKRPNGKKYNQCRVMDCLFKSDKTLLNGVEMSTILTVSKSVISNNDNMKRQIQNDVAEINKKVAERNGPIK